MIISRALASVFGLSSIAFLIVCLVDSPIGPASGVSWAFSASPILQFCLLTISFFFLVLFVGSHPNLGLFTKVVLLLLSILSLPPLLLGDWPIRAWFYAYTVFGSPICSEHDCRTLDFLLESVDPYCQPRAPKLDAFCRQVGTSFGSCYAEILFLPKSALGVTTAEAAETQFLQGARDQEQYGELLLTARNKRVLMFKVCANY